MGTLLSDSTIITITTGVVGNNNISYTIILTTNRRRITRVNIHTYILNWLFTSAAGKLNQGLPGSNSTNGQSGSLTRDLRISRQAP